MYSAPLIWSRQREIFTDAARRRRNRRHLGAAIALVTIGTVAGLVAALIV